MADPSRFSKPRRGLLFSALFCASVFSWLLLSANALADEAPEAPRASVPVFIQSHDTVLEGVLNPGKSGEAGAFEPEEYRFLYKKSASECRGGGVAQAPEPSSGAGAQHVEVFVEGLEADSEYSVCLVARSLLEHKEAVSAPIRVKTRIAPEVPSEVKAVDVEGTTATLEGVLNPNHPGEAGSYEFTFSASGSCEGEGTFLSERRGGSDAGAQHERVEAKLSGLMPATRYTFCLTAFNEGDDRAESTPVAFTTSTTPVTIADESVSPVAATTATARAEISPGGLASTYSVELVSEAQFLANGWAQATSLPSPAAELPASNTAVSVAVQLSGLQPETTYRYRFIADNALGSAEGTPAAFATQPTENAGTALPDERVAELVSPPQEGEAYLPPEPYGSSVFVTQFKADAQFRAAYDGNALAWVGEPAASTGTGETGPGEGNEWLSERTPGGWTSKDITPTSSAETVFEYFSSDLRSGIIEGGAYSPLTGEVPRGCGPLYLRDDERESLSPLFSAATCGRPLYAGSTSDGSTVIFQDARALTPEAEEATEIPATHEGRHQAPEGSGEGCMFGCNLYERNAGGLTLVNEIEGKPVPSATFGGYSLEAHALTDFSHAISNDGSRIFWTDTQSGADMAHVYVLENGKENVPVSGAGEAEFWTATPDGHYAFYTEAGELWRFDTDTNTREALAGAGAGVQGVMGVNETGEDGGYVYFVADGALAEHTTAKTCETINAQVARSEREESKGLITEAQQHLKFEELEHEEAEERAGESPPHTGCNLYVRHGQETKLVGTLSPQDDIIKGFAGGGIEQTGEWIANLGERVAQVTPDGTHLVFQSTRSLTGYDNAYAGSRQLEVFVYSVETGQLDCASCDPTGVPPTVSEPELDTKLPEASENADAFMRRLITTNGNRVFFDTSEPLAPQDTNGALDVYEWEREGEGTCQPRTPARADGGCVSLLTGGVSKIDSFLIEADETGENVFFEHVGRLGEVQAPPDRNLVYDARVRGGFESASLACTGTGCQGSPPTSPSYATPPSETFSGIGDFPPPSPAKPAVKPLTRAQKLAKALKACKKDKKKSKRNACIKQAKRAYSAKKASSKAKKSSNDRGTK